MAMVTPIGVSKVAFDATQDTTFSFTSVGGDQVVANRIDIYNNTTGNLVYSNKVTTYAFSQTVPANTLANGTAYNFTFTTFDIDDNPSSPSSPILFYCYTSPTFEITNISSGDEIATSSYSFELTYSQSEGELINFVTFYLYDNNNVLLQQSEDIYSTSTESTVNFNYLISGFDNNTSYHIQAKGITLNGTQLETPLINFRIVYDYPSVFANLEVTNLCDKGYNQLKSNITNLVGYTTPNEPTYIDNSELDLLDITQQQKVYWSSESIINTDFAMQIWYKVGLEGEQFKLINKDNPNTYMVGELVREIPYARTNAWDYVQVTGYVDGVESFYIRSNYVELVNNTSYLILNFKYAPSANTFSLELNVYNQETNFIKWRHYTALCNNIITSDGDYLVDNNERIFGEVYGYELDTTFNESPIITNNDENIVDNSDNNISARIAGDSSNVVHNRLTNVEYDDDLNIVGSYKENNFGTTTEFFPIGTIELKNGIYDHIEFYKDYDRAYSTDYSNWSYNTLMLCNFNDNINGGSLEYSLENIEGIKIKARESGEFEYITLCDIPIETESDFNFTVYDYRAPNGANIEYSMVIMQNGGIEGAYVTSTIETKWRKLFISDNTMTLSLIGNVTLSDLSKNSPIGVLQPIDRQYPIVIKNSNIDYYSGSVSGTLLCEDYSTIDRAEIVKLRETWMDFLTNGKTKVIKDWNGNIFVAQISDRPTVALRQNLGNSIGDIAFSFVEQGKWNSQQDLYESGIIDVSP